MGGEFSEGGGSGGGGGWRLLAGRRSGVTTALFGRTPLELGEKRLL